MCFGRGKKEVDNQKKDLNEDTFMLIELSGIYRRKGAGLELS